MQAYKVKALKLNFLQFYIRNLWGTKNNEKIANSPEPEPYVFVPLEPEPEALEKNTRSWSRLVKNEESEPELLGKKVRSRSR